MFENYYPIFTDILKNNYYTNKKFVSIEKVIFKNPATIVFWDDGTKTVVKCGAGDKFSEELGLAMACTKKLFGNKSNFNNKFKKFLPGEL